MRIPLIIALHGMIEFCQYAIENLKISGNTQSFFFKSNLAPRQSLFRNLAFHPGWSPVFVFQLLTKFSSVKQIFTFSCFSWTCILFFFSALLRCNCCIMSALLRYDYIFKVCHTIFYVEWLFLSINTHPSLQVYFYLFIVLACVMIALKIYLLAISSVQYCIINYSPHASSELTL